MSWIWWYCNISGNPNKNILILLTSQETQTSLAWGARLRGCLVTGEISLSPFPFPFFPDFSFLFSVSFFPFSSFLFPVFCFLLFLFQIPPFLFSVLIFTCSNYQFSLSLALLSSAHTLMFSDRWNFLFFSDYLPSWTQSPLSYWSNFSVTSDFQNLWNSTTLPNFFLA